MKIITVYALISLFCAAVVAGVLALLGAPPVAIALAAVGSFVMAFLGLALCALSGG